MQKITNSLEKTQQQGDSFARSLLNKEYPYKETPLLVLLFGNLGAGKTTFLQGFAKELGIKKRIISPTFIIVRKYEIPNVIANVVKQSNSNNEIAASQAPRNDKLETFRSIRTVRTFYHIDLYRVQTEDDLKGLGLEEILKDKNAIVAIEWPEKLGLLTPKKRWEVYFETLGENERSITIEKVQ